MKAKPQLHLLGHLCSSPTMHHTGGWRHPESDAHQVLEAARYENLAIWMERGLFDGMFLVDYQHIQGLTETETSRIVHRGGQLALLEPLLVLMAMAGVTQHLGLAATMSTTLHSPYHLARSFASLDHLSGGRAGWNVVTSHDDHEAQNWGLDRLPDKKTRYDHADEVLEACSQLWETWDEDAVKVNRESGVFADPNAVHYRSYAGSSVWTRGGLTTPHSPQGRPVLMQAGASPRGLEFAARWAEVVFTIQSEPATMREFYGDLKERVRSVGRDPQHCLVFPSIEVLVGETEREAQEQAELLDSFRPDTGLDMVAIITGTDVSRLPLDTPFDQVPLGPDGPASQGFYDNLLGTSGSGRVRTLGEAANIMATNSQSPRLIGTADIIADQLQEQLESGCCDGFIITFALLPGDLIQFVERVVPELQKRGIYREEYAGSTFRENLQS